jgi:hypothetical protein
MKGLIRVSILALLLGARPAAAASFDEYALKAAFIFNFVQFVDWSPERLPAQMPLTICVFGDSPITIKLQGLTHEIVRGHPLAIRQLQNLRDVASCHVLFVPAAAVAALSSTLRQFDGAGILLVGEEAGRSVPTVVNLIAVDKRMTFEIDLSMAAMQHLAISSKLINLASRVTGSSKARRD